MGNYIYGMGRNGIRLYLLMKYNNKGVVAFVDRDPIKQVRCFDDVKCISLEEYKRNREENDLLVVSVNDNRILERFREEGLLNCVNSDEYTKSLDDEFIVLDTVEKVREEYNILLAERKL